MILTSTANQIYVFDQLIVHLFDVLIYKCCLSSCRNAVRLICISKVSVLFDNNVKKDSGPEEEEQLICDNNNLTNHPTCNFSQLTCFKTYF